jgi:hypothetical protein
MSDSSKLSASHSVSCSSSAQATSIHTMGVRRMAIRYSASCIEPTPWARTMVPAATSDIFWTRFRCKRVLEVVADFEESGGATLGLVAWELSVDELQVADAWEQAQAERLLEPAGRDNVHDEQLWRLTAAGWVAHDASSNRS